MAEAKEARELGPPDQVAIHQLVERVERLGRGQLRDRSGELGLERVTRDGCAFEERPRLRGQARELGIDSGGHGVRRIGVVLERLCLAGALEVPVTRELLEVEGVAAALAQEDRAGTLAQCLPEQLGALGGGERTELDARTEALAVGAIEAAGE